MLSIADFVLGSGSRKLVLSDTCIPAFSPVPTTHIMAKKAMKAAAEAPKKAMKAKKA